MKTRPDSPLSTLTTSTHPHAWSKPKSQIANGGNRNHDANASVGKKQSAALGDSPSGSARQWLSSRSIVVDRSQCCWARCSSHAPSAQNGGWSTLQDDSFLLEGVGQLSRLGQVCARHIEFQQSDAQCGCSLLQGLVVQYPR